MPALSSELAELKRLRAVVNRCRVQIRAELQAERLKDWQERNGRKHPARSV